MGSGLGYPHIINFQGLREDTVINAFLTAPGTTNGKVEDEVEGLVKWPDFRLIFFFFKAEYGIAINFEMNVIFQPFDGIYMKILPVHP